MCSVEIGTESRAGGHGLITKLSLDGGESAGMWNCEAKSLLLLSDRMEPIDGKRLQLCDLAGRPADFDRIHLVGFPESEREREFDRG
jgi:hypothetical protein